MYYKFSDHKLVPKLHLKAEICKIGTDILQNYVVSFISLMYVSTTIIGLELPTGSVLLWTLIIIANQGVLEFRWDKKKLKLFEEYLMHLVLHIIWNSLNLEIYLNLPTYIVVPDAPYWTLILNDLHI